MAGGRRAAGRSNSARSQCSDKTKSNVEREPVQQKLMFRHVLLPQLPVQSELMFELIISVFVSASLGMQYLNLYHTVWWLPHSHFNYAMNFYMIDVDVALFILILLNRRLMWSVIKALTLRLSPNRIVFYSYITARCAVLAYVVCALSWLTYRISLKYDTFRLLYLHYMLFIHLFVFGGGADSFLSLLPDYGADCRPVFHVCSADPEFVRCEMNHLKSDFNLRLKQIMYNSISAGYYAGIAPMFFAQSVLHYDWRFAAVHSLFVFLVSAALLWNHCLPARYNDVLHQCALHLGTWNHIQDRRNHVPFNLWSRDQLWGRGVLVRHCREYYKCKTMVSAAEPGNSHHSRFHLWFHNPVILQCVVLAVQCVTISVQLVYLAHCSAWYQLITGSLVFTSNVFPLFTMTRDCLVTLRVYRAERMALRSEAQ